MGGFAISSGGHPFRSRGGRNSIQTFECGSTVGDFDHVETAATLISYVRGADLGSGRDGHTSWQKAGGVRGLLAVLGMTDNLKQFPLMDRLGNVTGFKRPLSVLAEARLGAGPRSRRMSLPHISKSPGNLSVAKVSSAAAGRAPAVITPAPSILFHSVCKAKYIQ